MAKSRQLVVADKKLRAIARAQLRLKQRLETIDWEDQELLPATQRLAELAVEGKLPEFTPAPVDLKRLTDGKSRKR